MKKLCLFLWSLSISFNIVSHGDLPSTPNLKEMQKAIKLLKKAKSKHLENLTQSNLLEKIQQLVTMQEEITSPNTRNNSDELLNQDPSLFHKKVILNTLWPIYQKDLENIKK